MRRRTAKNTARANSQVPRGDAHASAILAVVRSIPRGRVATYGELAGLAGISSGHRIAARVMKHCPESLPWHRVIGKKDARRGQINIEDPDYAALQRALLEAERVVFDANGYIPLREYGWLSAPSAGARVEVAQAARSATRALRQPSGQRRDRAVRVRRRTSPRR